MKLYGLLGEKLSHSFSPKIHFEIFKNININGHYHLFNVEKKDLKSAIDGFKALKVQGVNVTIPYKVKVMEYLDSVSKEAKKIGAVNTICFQNGSAVGYNTDYYGFGMMLHKFNINVKNDKAVILGTGGASKAVVQYLVDKDIKDITFVSRKKEEVKKGFENFKIINYEELKKEKEGNIIINCTPCGMYPNCENSPIDKDIISKYKAAIDLIYNPKETLFLKYAKEKGIKGVNGLYMLVGQGIKSQELWNNEKIDEKIVDKIYNSMDI